MSFSLEPCLSALPQCRAVVLMSGPGLSWPQLRWSWLKWGCAPGKLCSVGLKNWAINGQALAKWHYNYTSVLLTYSNSNIGWKKKTWPCFWWHCLPANWTANLRWKLDIKMETKIKWKLGFYCIFGHAQIVIYTRMSFKNIEGRRSESTYQLLICPDCCSERDPNLSCSPSVSVSESSHHPSLPTQGRFSSKNRQ